MALKLYNSLGRRPQTFSPIVEGKVGMYTCGPTVWNYAHVGNLRTFIFEDLIHRYLTFKGYKVKQVMNITDVEDKIIKGIKQTGKSRKELCDFYEKAFFEDLDTLRVQRAEAYPRATEHIGEMVSMVKLLIGKGFAYKASDDSYYFDVSKFREYGALSGIRTDELKSGARVANDHYEKEEANDFALWKAWDPEDGEVFWDTELGKGRPGWHIECSAMSRKYLGDSFDIHTGGLDNRFPHHENEIAQSEAATGKTFVRFWLHGGLLTMNGEDMHKSIGNVVYLRDLVAKGWDPLVIRLFLISARYRDPIDLTEASLVQARALQTKLQDFLARLRSVEAPGGEGFQLAKDLLTTFEVAMDDDMNTPRAFTALQEAAKSANKLMDGGVLGVDAARGLVGALERINQVLGILEIQEKKLPDRLALLVTQREDARRRRDFVEADRLRKVLLEEGIAVEDSPSGTVWKYSKSG